VEFENDEVCLVPAVIIVLGSDIFSQVTCSTVSMLLRHPRSAEPTVEAVIAPENTFVDIIRAFSVVSRTANPDDPRLSSNMFR